MNLCRFLSKNYLVFSSFTYKALGSNGPWRPALLGAALRRVPSAGETALLRSGSHEAQESHGEHLSEPHDSSLVRGSTKLRLLRAHAKSAITKAAMIFPSPRRRLVELKRENGTRYWIAF
ncbi:hypothetical protein MRX96_037482 [Rhipicephalus microplus]